MADASAASAADPRSPASGRAAATEGPRATKGASPAAEQEVDQEARDHTLASTERASPTQPLYDQPEQDAKPFSVGGIIANVGEDTWFKMFGFFQVRYLLHWQSTGDAVDRISAFSVPRARLFFQGHLTDWFGALLRVGATQDGALQFEQAYADFRHRRLTVRVGQWYLQLFREQYYSPDQALTANPSAVGGVFDGGQTQGLDLRWDFGPTRFQASVNDGLRTGFSELGSPASADIAVSTRASRILGSAEYGRFDTASSFRGESAAALLGLSAHYQAGGLLRDDSIRLGVVSGDVTFEGNGYNLHTSLAYAVYGGGEQPRTRVGGFVTQGGVFVLPWTELFARYEVLLSDTEGGGEPAALFRGITGGVGQYFWPSRGLRAIADFVYYFDGTEGTLVEPNANAGLLQSDDAQWVLRLQLNVVF